MSDDGKTFDPARHLTKVKGSDYLEVKWRIAWFRDEWPAGRIATDLVSHSGNGAIFRAEVTKLESDGTICGSATGYGSCDVNSFADYIGKAETKAIGRALAALGFGTQFADDFSDGDQIADAPVQRGNDRNQQPTPMRSNAGQQQGTPGGASQPQINAILAIGKGLGMDRRDLVGWIQDYFQAEVQIDDLTKADASTVIEELNKLKGGQ